MYDIKDIVVEHNKSSDTTVVFVQGGLSRTPLTDRSLIMADLTKSSFYYAKSMRFLKEFVCEYVNFAQVKQVHHIRDVKVKDYNHAIELQKENIDLIHQAVEHYRNLNHKVILFGHSAGAVIIKEYIKHKGIKHIEKVVLANSRFNFPNFVPESIEKRQVFIRFDKHGNKGAEESYRDNRKLKLLYSVLLYNDYTKQLKNIDLSKVTLICADGDSLTGTISQEELDFIEESNVNLIRFKLWKSYLYKIFTGKKMEIGQIAHHLIFTPSAIFKLKRIIHKDSKRLKYRYKMDTESWISYRKIRKILSPIAKMNTILTEASTMSYKHLEPNIKNQRKTQDFTLEISNKLNAEIKEMDEKIKKLQNLCEDKTAPPKVLIGYKKGIEVLENKKKIIKTQLKELK